MSNIAAPVPDGGVPPEMPPPPYSADEKATAPLKYIGVSANQEAVYLLRSDGAIDRSTGGGKVSRQLKAPEPHTFVAVSAGPHATYALRSDGAGYRTRKGSSPKNETDGEIRPPPNIRYVAVGAGPSASYLLRSDGKIDRFVGSTKVDKVLEPEGFPAVKYTAISSGHAATYLARSDGKIDRIKSGSVSMTMVPEKGKYVMAFPQLTWMQYNGQTAYEVGSYAIYVLRDDGVVIRTVSDGKVDKEYSAAEGRYVRGASGESSSYLVTDKGCVERLRGHGGDVHETIVPDGNFTYIDVAAGESAAYLLRSDGLVDRTKSKGKISETMRPPTDEEIKAHGGCSVM